MKVYLFPFSKIEKNTRIALYAAGVVGHAYFQQLQVSGYAEVVIWVDKFLSGKNIVRPSVLQTLSADMYDTVLIAVEYEQLACEISIELTALGIDERKIIFAKPIVCTMGDITGRCSSLSLDEILSGNHWKVSSALDDYFAYSNGYIDYFADLVNEIIEYTKSDDSRKKAICEIVIDIISCFNKQPQYNLVLIRLLFESGCFFSDALQLVIKNASLLDSRSSQKYWAFVDICSMWFDSPNALFSEFFPELQKLGGAIAADWDLSWDPPRYEYGGNNKICLILPYLTSGALLPYLSPIVAEFTKRGYEIHILDIEFNLYDGGAEILKPRSMCLISNSTKNQSIRKYFPGSVTYHYADVKNVKKRQERILSIIASINPVCIFDASTEVGIISYYIYKKYPVINMPMRKAGYSSSFFHKIIINSGEVEYYPPITEEQVIRLFPAFERKQPERVFSRSEFGFSDSDIVCVTVGLRLSLDLSLDLFESMCKIMSDNKAIKWLIIGAEVLPYTDRADCDVISNSVHFIGWESDITGLYQICDIYVNPSRVGGGTTIVWALQAGLAVVTPKDAAAGLTIVGDINSVESEDNIAPKVTELATDPVLLAKEKANMRKRSSEWSIELYIDKLEAEMLHLAKDFPEGVYSCGI